MIRVFLTKEAIRFAFLLISRNTGTFVQMTENDDFVYTFHEWVMGPIDQRAALVLINLD